MSLWGLASAGALVVVAGAISAEAAVVVGVALIAAGIAFGVADVLIFLKDVAKSLNRVRELSPCDEEALRREGELLGRLADKAAVDGTLALLAASAVAKFGGGVSKFIRKAFGDPKSVWAKNPLQRGVDIENAAANTTYKDWFRVGQLNNGKFPLVDFQKGNNLVSLKSVDPSSSTAISRGMQSHIDALSRGEATVNGQAANMILDIRVPQGTEGALRGLVEYGRQAGVTVEIQGF